MVKSIATGSIFAAKIPQSRLFAAEAIVVWGRGQLMPFPAPSIPSASWFSVISAYQHLALSMPWHSAPVMIVISWCLCLSVYVNAGKVDALNENRNYYYHSPKIILF